MGTERTYGQLQLHVGSACRCCHAIITIIPHKHRFYDWHIPRPARFRVLSPHFKLRDTYSLQTCFWLDGTLVVDKMKDFVSSASAFSFE